MENNKRFMTRRAFSMWIKTVACVLSILMMLYAVPTNVFAELIDAIDGALENQADEVTVEDTLKKEVFEVIDRREETVKHFRTEDGSFTAVQYNVPVHEKDENGEWKDIDNTLSESGSEYATSNARVKFAKKTTGNETLFTLHDGNRKITMSLSGANKKVAGHVTNTQTEFPEDATQLQKMMTLDKLSSKILYPEILDGVDLEYVVNSCNIKENIIVKERADSYNYTFEIQLNNLEAVLCEDGSVAISDPDTDEVVYTIPKGYMFDADGAYSEAVEYSLTNGGNGKYSLTVTADAEWINDEGRAFPVTVDPPINVTTDASSMIDTYVSQSSPNGTFYLNTQLRVGYSGNNEYRAFWKVNTLPDFPENTYLIKASFMMDCLYTGAPNTFTFATKIGVYGMSSSNWTTGMTWNNRSNYFIADADNIIDYRDIPAATSTSSTNWISWDITSLYMQWLSNPNSNHGLALASIDDIKKDYAVFSSANSAAYIPCIIIEYRDMKGVESYWSTSSHSAGLAGNGYVNHATGDLVFSLGTLTTTDGLFGYTPSIIYNSAISEDYYYSGDNDNVYYSSLTTGQGLKLSISESIMEGSYTDKNGEQQTYFVWSDSDGTEHYFLCDEYEQSSVEDPYDREYKDEDGLQLTLTINTSENKIVITHSDNSCRVFSAEFNSNKWCGVLSYLQDKYGNRLYPSAESNVSNKTIVKILPKGHAAENAIEYMTFTYHSVLGQLMEIRDSVSGYVVQIEYGNTFDDSAIISSTCCGPLRRIKFGHLENSTIVVDRTVSYGYTQCADGLYRLSYAKDDDAKIELQYEYDTLGRVIKANEIAYVTENGVEVEKPGQSVSFTYGIGYTEVRSSGEDDILQTGTASDDIITHYTLDRYGRAISAYSTNAARTAMYGATNCDYDKVADVDETIIPNESAKNSIKATAIVNSIAANYVYNGSFEITSSSSSSTPYGWLTTGNVAVTSLGLHSNKVSLTISNTNTSASITQYVTLPNGTYTLSAKCVSEYCNGAVTSMSVEPATNTSTSPKHCVDIQQSATMDTTTQSEPVLTFDVDGGSAMSETYMVVFQIEKVENASSCEGSITIDQIMLTANIGAAQYNMIQNGNFDGAAYSTSSRTDNKFSNVWQYASGDEDSTWATFKTVANDFGKSLVITGDINDYRTYGQTVIPPNLNETGIANRSRTFILSGFGKGDANVANEEAFFSLDVEVYYTDSTTPQRFYFDFNKDTKDWQFLSTSFTTKRNKTVSYIVIYCTYANQTGEAYFDEISLVEASGGNAVAYDYDNKGRMTMSMTTDKVTYYEYDDSASHNEPVRIIDSQYNLVERAYSTAGVLKNEKVYKYKPKTGISVYDFDSLLTLGSDGKTYTNVTLEGISQTTYSINSYGLNYYTTVTSLSGGDTQTLSSRTEYDTVVGSRTFGRTLRAVTTSGQAIRYQYDNKGLLVSEVTEGEGGLYYTYDAIGRTSQVVPYLYFGSGDSYYLETYTEKATYTYNAKNQLETITTATTTYTFAYDDFGNTKSIKAGESPWVSYEYAENNGKLRIMTYGNGNSVVYSYDELDRISELCYTYKNSSGQTVTESYLYSYTAAGEIHSVKSTEADREYAVIRDSDGRAVFFNEIDSTSGSELLKISYTYDEQNRLSGESSKITYTTSNGSASTCYNIEIEYNDDNSVQEYSIQIPDLFFVTLGYTYDVLNRITEKTVAAEGFSSKENYTYKPLGGMTTNQVGTFTSTIGNSSTTYSYAYDTEGNITHITDGNGNVTCYDYDNLGQLIREDNPYLGKSYTYSYDYAGNRTSKRTYTYTTGSLSSLTYTEEKYEYNNVWGDQLTNANGVAISYDASGNPTTFNGYDLTWNGHQLKVMSRNGGQSLLKFKYNADGIRTNKIVDGTDHVYTLNGTQIVSESWGNFLLIYLYDEFGSPIGLQYRTQSYAANVFDTFYFEKNLQGDIIAVYNESGDKIGFYTYDAWGACTANVVSGNSTLENKIVRMLNPFRYRGYYYDTETGLYYLQSRYYNPQWGRFLNADEVLYTGTKLLGYNMYAYCNNNPISYKDSSGKWPILALVLIVVVTLSLSSCRNSYGNTTSNETMSPAEESEWIAKNEILQYGRYEEFAVALDEGLNEANQKSKSTGVEYAGFVYKRYGGYYYETGADIRFSTADSVTYEIDLPDDAELIAVFHTHPIDKSNEDVVFSIADYNHCKDHGVDSYVIDPNDNVFKLPSNARKHTDHVRIK